MLSAPFAYIIYQIVICIVCKVLVDKAVSYAPFTLYVSPVPYRIRVILRFYLLPALFVDRQVIFQREMLIQIAVDLSLSIGIYVLFIDTMVWIARV